MRGYTLDQTATERQWETRYRAIPDPANLQEYMRVISAEPHHAGGPGSKQVAEYILQQFQSWGLDARIEQFEALMPMPTERRLELIEPETYRAKLAESAFREDEDTSDPGKLPSVNAYSADGDVTGELVYVNYGIPEDYERLEQMGIDVEGENVIFRFGGRWRGNKAKLA